MLIFVQIAAYRDPQIKATIKDLLSKAKYPDKLRFGICNQIDLIKDQSEKLDEYSKDFRFRIFQVNYTESKGVCWARSITQSLYRNEEFTLQIDSHSRFVRNWDVRMIEMFYKLQKIGFKKPILTCYPQHFDPKNKTHPYKNYKKYSPTKMVFDRFTSNNMVICRHEVISDFKKIKMPIQSRFLAAGFFFTLGSFCKEVLYDQEIYFIGEETLLAIKAYLNGYDFFHPNEVLMWHYYERDKNIKHWDDDKEWTIKEKKSSAFVKNTLANLSKTSKEIFLDNRNFTKYIVFSGVDFVNKTITENVYLGIEPSVNENKRSKIFCEYFFSIRIYSHYSLKTARKINLRIYNRYNRLIYEVNYPRSTVIQKFLHNALGNKFFKLDEYFYLRSKPLLMEIIITYYNRTEVSIKKYYQENRFKDMSCIGCNLII